MSTESSPGQAIVTAILASQLMSVPFTCSLTLLVSIFAWRYISKTSARGIPKLGYFEYPCTNSRPTRTELTRAGAGLVASVCVVLTSIELVHVYQAAVEHPRDLSYFQKTPWTFALIPILTAIVNATSQLYFSHKACKNHLELKLLTVLGLLGIISLVGGVSSSIAMVVSLARSSHNRGTPVSERLFWAYLTTSTISSGLISFLLVGSYMKQRQMIKRESLRNAAVKFERFTFASVINFFVSSYTLVFILEISSFICACASLSSNFTVALHASQAFFFLQRLTICFMSLSLVYALLKENASTPSESPSANVTFEKVQESDPENGRQTDSKQEIIPRRPNRPSEVDVQDIGRFDLSTYNISEHKPLSSEEEEEFDELFADTFPSEVVPVAEDNPVTNTSWPIVNRISASLSLPEKALGEFTALPSRSSSLLLRQKQPTLTPMRSLQLMSDHVKPTPVSNQRSKKYSSKSKNRQSQLKYIISPPIPSNQPEAFNGIQEESVTL
ncbi:hypothetical protein PGTUg99_006846 [Puccinia graminis f. sp. tritici]|uniref:Uncharacterized protein n=1 Tax=Puccinia graminis f. sp. tritici TaxID=56615 RepID=A0A5B0NGE8_PUCGR|nr:hypothetical protein PGTUg99_006846 [Puccinia graminis f. sp. tritici]